MYGKHKEYEIAYNDNRNFTVVLCARQIWKRGHVIIIIIIIVTIFLTMTDKCYGILEGVSQECFNVIKYRF